MKRAWILLVCLLPLAVSLALWLGRRNREADHQPAPAAGGGFAGSAACVECHEEQHGAWMGSHHERAMLDPTAESVLADFEDARFSQHGVETRFHRKDGGYFVETDGADGKRQEFRVRYTFGWHPLQQFIVDAGNGRMQALTVAWNVDARRWFPLYDEPIPPGDPLHWCGPQFTWNHMCAECHTTDFRKNYDAKSDAYGTAWSEVNVACEACHGPGQSHAAWARKPDRNAEEPSLFANPKGPSQVESCAPCHSRRSRLTGDESVSGGFLDHYDPALLTETLYHADGQILDEVYVWGSFQQSKMHGAGVICTDCHDPHTARLKREGNAVCTECHRTDPPERLPTLKKRAYETYEHHGHEPGQAGSQCVDCHMAARTYMGIDVRHDHSFRVPRPDLTIAIGTPNACATCHADRPAEWAVEAVQTMGEGQATGTPHFGLVFAEARRNLPVAVPGLIRILHGEAAPAIVRATAARELQRFATRESLAALADALADKEPLVRAAAASAIGRLPWSGGEIEKALAQLLGDPVRLVRINATQAWRGEKPAPRDEVDARNRLLADRAEGSYNEALACERAGDADGAERGYRRSIARDPNFVPARFNFGNLLARIGRPGEAEDQFRAVLDVEPANGEAYYSLGLLAAEAGRMPDAAAALTEAARLLPDRARVRYNLALALDSVERPGEARAALEAAHAMERRNPEFLHALVAHHAKQKEWEPAIRYARALATLLPNDPQVAQLLQAVLQESSR